MKSLTHTIAGIEGNQYQAQHTQYVSQQGDGQGGGDPADALAAEPGRGDDVAEQLEPVGV